MLFLLALSLFAISCGDDDDGTESPSGDVTDREEQEAILSQVVITDEDNPEGLNQVSRAFFTNEDSAAGAADPEEALTQFEEWGRLLGLSVQFTVDPNATESQPFVAMQSDASLFEDDRGARRSYQFDTERAQSTSDEAWATSLPEHTDIQVSEPVATAVGEEAYWVRVSGITPGGQNVTIIDQVLFRQGTIRGYLRMESRFLATAPRNSGEGRVLFWAQTMSDRAVVALAAEGS